MLALSSEACDPSSLSSWLQSRDAYSLALNGNPNAQWVTTAGLCKEDFSASSNFSDQESTAQGPEVKGVQAGVRENYKDSAHGFDGEREGLGGR